MKLKDLIGKNKAEISALVATADNGRFVVVAGGWDGKVLNRCHSSCIPFVDQSLYYFSYPLACDGTGGL